MNFLFGIGVEKCGTTSLFETISELECFNPSVEKETFFFSHHYSEGLDTYFKMFNSDPKIFKGFNVDFTPLYHRNHMTMDRIEAFEANKKILICLRNPLERAWSHYTHDLRNHVLKGHGSENFSDMSSLSISFEKSYRRGEVLFFPKYAPIISDCYKRFGKENCKVILLEDMKKDWLGVAKELDVFLGNENQEISHLSLRNSNYSSSLAFFGGHEIDENGNYTLLQLTANGHNKIKELSLIQVNNAYQLQKDIEVSVSVDLIDEIFMSIKNDILDVENLIDRNLNLWKKPDVLQIKFCKEKNTMNHTDSLRARISRFLKPKIKKQYFHLKDTILANKYVLPNRRRSIEERNLAIRTSKDHSVNGQWPASPELMPWFDQPDALDYLKNGIKCKESDKSILKKWVNDGYFVAKILTSNQCDELLDDINNNVWNGKREYPNIRVIGLSDKEKTIKRTINRAEFLSYSQEQRDWMKQNNNWRIHGLMDISECFGELAKNKEIIRLSSLIFNEPAEVGFSLNFGNGSEQTLHQDISQFNIYPRNYLIGVWIALEDIHPDSGPLMYYPGTHKLGLWHKHARNYPQTNLNSLTPEENAEYFAWIAKQSKEMSEIKHLIIKKGQVLFWHPCLAHGGSKRINPALSRHSNIFHMVPRNKDVDKRLIVKSKL